MPAPISLFPIDFQKQSMKGVIVSLLSIRWPLSAKEICSSLRREFSVSSSYQAVHKSLSELTKSNVLERVGLKYRLSRDWISRVKNFADKVEKLYAAKNEFLEFQPSDVVNFRFSNFIECGKFMINEFYAKFPNPDKKDDVSFNEHAWLLIGGGDKDFESLKKICSRSNIFNITKSGSVLDRVASGFLSKLGKKCLVGVNPPIEGDVYIVGDYVAQVYFPSEFKKKFFKVYQSTKDFSKFDLPSYFRLISSDAFITVTVSKNAELADFLREENRKIFAKRGFKSHV